MPEDWRNARRRQYLGHLSEAEQNAVSKFMGTGLEEAATRLRTLTAGIPVNFRKSSLVAFHKYVSVLAGGPEDFPRRVWSIRKELLEKAISLGLGLPG
jgi:hypothetical protein